MFILIVPTNSNESFACASEEISSTATPQTVELVVELGAEASPAPTPAAQPTCSRRLGEFVVSQFKTQFASALESTSSDEPISIEIPYPDRSAYDGCSRVDEFVPVACLSNSKIIHIVHSQIVAQHSELAPTHTFKLIAKLGSVEILVRPKPVASAAASASEAVPAVNRYQSICNTATERGRPFPTSEEVSAALAAAVPHKEGLSRSAVYTVGSDESGVGLFCRRLGLKFCITKDQPKQEGLIRFRVFAEDKEGFVSKANESGPGPKPKRGGGGGKGSGGAGPGLV